MDSGRANLAQSARVVSVMSAGPLLRQAQRIVSGPAFLG